MLTLSTAPQLPKGHAHEHDDDPPRSGAGVAMAPPQNRRSTDLMQTTVSLPSVIQTIIVVLTMAGAVWTIKADMQSINVRLDYEAQLREQMFKTLEAKIDAAGLRNAAMSLSQELAKTQEKLKGR